MKALQRVPFVLAIENETHRERMVATFAELGFLPEQVGSAGIVWQLTREQFANSWVILDTNDDVAWLVQSVNDYHRSRFHTGGSAPIICMGSLRALEANPRLGFWLIDGSAAVASVLVREWEDDIRQWLIRITRQHSKNETEPMPPSPYDDLVAQVVRTPADGQALLALGVRLCEWQNSHQARYETGRAFLRHAVRLLPNSPQAHLHYANSFRVAQWEEAERHAREAIRLAPDQAEAYLTLGRLQADKDKPEALKALLKAIELDPQGNIGRMAKDIIVRCELA